MRLLTALFEGKPLFATTAIGGGFISGLLTWLQVITPVIGFLGAVLGLTAGIITVMIKWREWTRGK